MDGPIETPKTQTSPSGGPPPPPKKTARGIDDLPPKGPDRKVVASGGGARPVWGLYLWLIRFLAIFIMVVVWAGYFFLLGTWPTPPKLWLCSALGVGAILNCFIGRGPSIRALAPPGARITVSPFQAIGVVALVIATSIFLTWVTIDPIR